VRNKSPAPFREFKQAVHAPRQAAKRRKIISPGLQSWVTRTNGTKSGRHMATSPLCAYDNAAVPLNYRSEFFLDQLRGQDVTGVPPRDLVGPNLRMSIVIAQRYVFWPERESPGSGWTQQFFRKAGHGEFENSHSIEPYRRAPKGIFRGAERASVYRLPGILIFLGKCKGSREDDSVQRIFTPMTPIQKFARSEATYDRAPSSVHPKWPKRKDIA
jgi:hypothetical protein